MMTLDITPSHADVLHGGRVVGTYRYRDAFKPHLHPLRTPRGHTVTLASPHDHVHHKGLMYALRTPAVNFWEERGTADDEAVGAQRHAGFSDVVAGGDEVGFDQDLLWVSTRDGAVVFRERRTVRCRSAGDPPRPAYAWTWHARLTAEHDTTLVQSQWSWPGPDGGGRRTNYHGLGIRLRRDFGGQTGGNRLVLDGAPLDAADFTAAMGRAPREVTYTGSLDETWPVERASVTFRQAGRNALFVLNQQFAFMALGPSNAAPLAVTRGQTIDERYEVVVADGPP